MMKSLMAFLCLLSMVLLSGCGTIYDAAVDTRSVSTIASDTSIKSKIMKKFFDDSVLGTLDFSVSSYYGNVLLVGEYAINEQKSRAISLAQEVEGVKGVSTYMLKEKKNDSCGVTTNLAITVKVSAKLIEDKDIWSTNIDVKTMQCDTVALWGLVDKQIESDRAEVHAKSVAGVKRVKNMIQVHKKVY